MAPEAATLDPVAAVEAEWIPPRRSFVVPSNPRIVERLSSPPPPPLLLLPFAPCVSRRVERCSTPRFRPLPHRYDYEVGKDRPRVGMYRRVAPVPRTRLVVDSGSIERKFIPSRVEFCKTLPAIQKPTFPFSFFLSIISLYIFSLHDTMKEREKKREQSFFPLLIVLSLGYLSTIVSSSSLEAARLTHFDTCIGHFDACLLMICDKQVRRVDPAWRERHRMLIASRNVNRSIVNLYCNLDTSRKKKRKTERERK